MPAIPRVGSSGDGRMNRTRVLVVDDDEVILKFLWASLTEEGFEVLTATDGRAALRAVEEGCPHLVVLDIMLPEIDGFEVCRLLRERSHLPIIALSARGGLEDKVKCLNLGADDYVTKPFATSELIARMKSALRRSIMNDRPSTPPAVVFGDLEIDFSARRVVVEGRELRLTPTDGAPSTRLNESTYIPT